MKNIKKFVALLLCLTLTLSFAACRIVIDGETASAGNKVNGSIGLSVSTQNNPFFVTLVDGAKAQADKLGVKIQVTDAGDDAAKQTTDIETLVASGISVLIVNPVDSDAVTGAVEAAKTYRRGPRCERYRGGLPDRFRQCGRCCHGYPVHRRSAGRRRCGC